MTNPIYIRHSTKAAASLTSDAKKISKGKKKTRVQFGENTASGLHVRAKVVSGKGDRVFAFFAKTSQKYIEVNINNERVLLNVNSVAHRLHLTKNEIQATKTQKKFIPSLINHAITTDQTLNNYNELLKDHFSGQKVKRKENLIRNNGNKAPLNAPTLMKIIRTSLDHTVGTGIRFKDDPLILATQLENGVVDLGFIERSLYKAESGELHTVNHLRNKEKTVHKSSSPSGLEHREKEVRVVQMLNKNGPHEGISLPVHRIEVIGSKDEEIGILMPHYERDYWDACTTLGAEVKKQKHLTKPQILEIVLEFEKLSSGLRFCHKNGIVHGDIKPQNILCREGRLDLIDFEGAMEIEKGELAASAVTLNYCHTADQEQEERLVRTDDTKGLIFLAEERDVLALGIVFYNRVTGSVPFKLTPEDESTGNLRPLPKHLPKNLSALIEQMLKVDYAERSSAKEVHLSFQAYRQQLEKEIAKTTSPKSTSKRNKEEVQ